MTEVVLQTEWIERLKHYTDTVRETANNDFAHKQAVVSLLGYLDSLEFLLKTNP